MGEKKTAKAREKKLSEKVAAKASVKRQQLAEAGTFCSPELNYHVSCTVIPG